MEEARSCQALSYSHKARAPDLGLQSRFEGSATVGHFRGKASGSR